MRRDYSANGARWLLREIVSRFYGVIRNILLCGMENDVYFFFLSLRIIFRTLIKTNFSRHLFFDHFYLLDEILRSG